MALGFCYCVYLLFDSVGVGAGQAACAELVLLIWF